MYAGVRTLLSADGYTRHTGDLQEEVHSNGGGGQRISVHVSRSVCIMVRAPSTMSWCGDEDEEAFAAAAALASNFSTLSSLTTDPILQQQQPAKLCLMRKIEMSREKNRGSSSSSSSNAQRNRSCEHRSRRLLLKWRHLATETSN